MHLSKIPFRFNVLKSILLCILLNSTIADSFEFIDYSYQIEPLGNPYNLQNYPSLKRYDSLEQPYAKNIWDMHVFMNKIFLGAGNSSNVSKSTNIGPITNAGPVPIMALDPVTERFTIEGAVNDEQIDNYIILNNHLIIPGHDPRENWTLGNFYYRSDNGIWQKIRNIPNGLHTYAMEALHKNELFAGLGMRSGGGIARSIDNGNSWDIFPTNTRIYSFLKLQNKLYAVGSIKSTANTNLIYEYLNKGSFIERKDLTPQIIFPDSKLNVTKSVKVIRSKTVDHMTIYIGAYAHNDHQSLPFGVYIAYSFSLENIHVKAIQLPENVIPWDILIRENDVYLLASENNIFSTNEVKNYVFHARTNSLEYFEPYFQFRASSFARSFELLNNVFYFGLGAEIEHPENWTASSILNSHAGDILKLKR